MPVLPNMGLITPTQGADSGVWDDKINAAFVQVDAHDHTSGKGVAIPIAGLNINADLSMGGFGITGLSKITFSTIAAPTSGGKNLYVDTADNELYWRSNAGTNVKITSGTTLNFTLVGGIVGDYSAVGAEVAFDDANDRYTFKQQGAPKPWARLASGPVRIHEFNTNETVYVEHAAAAALAASYTVTWPAALPAVVRTLSIDTAGNILAGDDTVRVLQIGPGLSSLRGGTGANIQNSVLRAETDATVQTSLGYPIALSDGDIIVGWKIYYKKNSNASTTLTFRLYEVDSTTEVETAKGDAQTDNTNGGGFSFKSHTLISPITISGTNGKFYYLNANNGGVSNANDFYYLVELSYKHR